LNPKRPSYNQVESAITITAVNLRFPRAQSDDFITGEGVYYAMFYSLLVFLHLFGSIDGFVLSQGTTATK
jgi:hypothetical protein